MAAASPLQDMQEETTCPICLEAFKDPVITPCGHNFCRCCIEGCLEGPDAPFRCPQCRETCPRADVRPNRQLQKMVELVRKLSAQQQEAAQRGKWVCEQHEEKLKLFCQDDKKLVCVICQVSNEHQKHKIRPITEAAQEYQGKLQNWLPRLKKERDVIVVRKQKEEEEYKTMRENLEAEKVKTAEEFARLRQMLRKQEQTILRRLEKMDKKITMVEDANLAKLSSEISSLDALIKEIETKCTTPPEELLQDVELTLSKCSNVKFVGPEKKMKENKPKEMKDLGKINYQKLEEMRRYKVVVTLNSETAYGSLNLFENKKRVKYSRKAQYESHSTPYESRSAQNNLFCAMYGSNSMHHALRSSYNSETHAPKKFTASPCVLGSEGFTSGRHYWEVQLLQEGQGWTVGVARESIKRDFDTRRPPQENSYGGTSVNTLPESPGRGVWAVHGANGRYVAQTSPCTVLNPCEPPKKLGVYLDYEGKQVSLYNGDTMEVLYTFSDACFKERVYPYFNLSVQINADGTTTILTDLRLV